MAYPAALIASIFPWDPRNESAISHHHLIIGYAFAWTVQLTYLLSILWKKRTQRTQIDREARRQTNAD